MRFFLAFLLLVVGCAHTPTFRERTNQRLNACLVKRPDNRRWEFHCYQESWLQCKHAGFELECGENHVK